MQVIHRPAPTHADPAQGAAEAGGAVPALLAPAQAAAYLGISPSTLTRRAAAGEIVRVRVSHRVVRYARADLDVYLTSVRTQPAAPHSAIPSV